MAPRTPSQDPPPATRSRRGGSSANKGATSPEPSLSESTEGTERETPAGGDASAPGDGPAEEDIAADLSFREAQTALELSLGELQAPDLDVEEMAGLYRRACRYAERCEQLLRQVEQEVMQWDPAQPQASPIPYQA